MNLLKFVFFMLKVPSRSPKGSMPSPVAEIGPPCSGQPSASGTTPWSPRALRPTPPGRRAKARRGKGQGRRCLAARRPSLCLSRLRWPRFLGSARPRSRFRSAPAGSLAMPSPARAADPSSSVGWPPSSSRTMQVPSSKANPPNGDHPGPSPVRKRFFIWMIWELLVKMA